MNRTKNAGGQAVIEGVMMRCGERVSVAVRSPDGEIDVYEEEIHPLSRRYPILGWPIIRGAISLYESLSVGIRALMYSANAQAECPEEELTHGEMMGAMGFAVVLAVVLFILLPTFLSSLVATIAEEGLFLNLMEGLIRLIVVVAYIASIGFMPDIGRVLEYHGAEHKVIRAWEKQRCRVQASVARPESTQHVRCGTSFILMVAVVSIFIFSFFGWPSFWGRVGLRLLLLPFVAGVAYELIMAADKWDNPVVKALIMPGLWLQKLTTREPAQDQLEVATVALNHCLQYEGEDEKKYD